MRSKISQSLLLSLLLSGCASIPDKPVCVELSPVKGFCTNTVSDKDFIIDETHPAVLEEGQKPQTWWEMRPFMVLVPVSSWKAFKEFIIKQCKRTNCDQYIQAWERKTYELEQGASQ